MSADTSKKTIQDKALAQMREIRAEIEKDHPQLFKALRLLVSQSQQPKKASVQQSAKTDVEPQDSVKIDRQKNLEAVIKYAALNPGSEKLRAQLKEFIN